MTDAYCVRDYTWPEMDDSWLLSGSPAQVRWGESREVVLGAGELDVGVPVPNPRLYDHLPSAFIGIIASERVTAAALETAKGEFEPLKIYARLPSQQSPLIYYLWNILDLVPCLSRSKSGIRRVPQDDPSPGRGGTIAEVRTPVIDTSVVGSRSILRDSEAPGPVYVSEAMKRAIEEAHGTGFGFIPMATTSE